MKDYVTTTDIWRAGVLVPAGSPVRMSDAEAKYLRHALAEPAVAEAEPAVEQVELVFEVTAPRRRRPQGR